MRYRPDLCTTRTIRWTRALITAVVPFVPFMVHAQGDASSWRDDLFVMAEGGLVWRSPTITGTADRIGTGVHTDGFWGVGVRAHLRNTMVSAGWARHQRSMYYTIADKGTATSKRTLASLAYTSLPVRIGQRFPIWHRRIHVVPYVALVWSFADEREGLQTSHPITRSLQIDNNTGDTVNSVASASTELLTRNTFTLGPGLELNATFGRWTALAGAEYLWSSARSVVFTVDYTRTSTLSGNYQERATITQTPTVLALRWGVFFRLKKDRPSDAGSW